ncbi:MAG TPA: SulP family inorganic anion transporter [Gemmatimonadales bacterium]|nr:SulP family inorganic anion transporter [Gemmatimonadales bacterium]
MNRRPPVLEWLAGYRTDWLRSDAVAGLAASAVVIPKAMAYATVAGLPVQVGLYTVLVPALLYALLGTSRVLSVSTTTTLAILLAAELAAGDAGADPAAIAGMVATLTLLVGLALAAAAVLRLGFVANFISEPVLVGFKAGIGLVIVLDQLPKLLGVHIAKSGFFHDALATFVAAPQASLATLAVGLLTIALLLGVEHRLPQVPAPLLAIAVGIAASRLLDLPAHGVAVVGEIPTGLPRVVLPELGAVAWLWPAALGIALMSFTESIAAARAFAGPGEPELRPNRELLALGLANAGGAVFGAMPAGGGTSQTAVNRQAGARTQLAGVVTAVATLLTMLLLARAMGRMPQATLAAIVIVYSIRLIQPASFRAIRHVRHMEFRWALFAFVGVIALGTLRGIVVAIVASLLGLAHQVTDPPVYVLGRKRGTNVFRPLSPDHPDDETFPGLLLLRLEGRVFFLNAGRVHEKVRQFAEAHRPRAVGIDLSSVPDLEYTALLALDAGERQLHADGVPMHLAGLTPGVLDVVRRSALGERLGPDRLHFNLEQVVAKFGATHG